MPVSTGDIIRGVWGAWRLARRDTDGMAMFDVSPDGAAKSFVAAALAAPAYMLLQGLVLGSSWPLLLQPGAFLVEALGYIAAWTLMPAALTWILPALDRGRRIPDGIVAYNWSALLIVIAQLCLMLVYASGLLPGSVLDIASVALMVACLFYEGFVLRTALDLEIPIVIGLVAFDQALSYILAGWVDLVAHAAR